MIKKIIFRVAVLLCACIFIFAVLELGVRIFIPQGTGPVQFAYDPELGAIPVPNQKGKRTRPDYTYSNNSWGLRGSREYSEAKEADLRILMLGDSFTYGLGVDDDQTFSSLLEKKFSAGKGTVEVINAGNPGKGTGYALKFFTTRGYKLRPDLVILCFTYTDFYDNQRSRYYRVNNDGSISAKSLENTFVAKKNFLLRFPLYDWLIRRSHLANLIRSSAIKIIAVGEERLIKKDADRVVVVYPADSKYPSINYDKKISGKFIELLHKEVEDAGAEFMIFYIAVGYETGLHRKGIPFAHEKNFNEILKGHKIPFFSTTGILAKTGMPIEELYIFDPPDNHFTVAGHQIVADFMYQKIQGWVLKQLGNK